MAACYSSEGRRRRASAVPPHREKERALPVPATSPAHPAQSIDDAAAWLAINTIRTLAMDAVEAASSGHPGTPMALAPAGYVLWTRHLSNAPSHPDWPNRDRFVLSCGHASMLLYSLLHLTGYDLPLAELEAFRQWGSRTPGHPERGHTPGVETTTGPLGQGLGNAVGMAMAERFLAQRFNRPGHAVIDHRTWVFASDGDLMEGVASEAASLAGHLRLDKLTVVYDDNHITIDGSTSLAFSEDVGRRFEAYGWHVLHVGDGNDLVAIDAALQAATEETDRPTLIVLRTIIGDPAPTKRDTAEAHGSPLGTDEVARTKKILGWPPEPFYVPEAAREHMLACRARGEVRVADWSERLATYRTEHPAAGAELEAWLAGRLEIAWDQTLPRFGAKDTLATRQASAKTLAPLAATIPNLIGGSADLAGSTGVGLPGAAAFGPGSAGQLIHWGIREHAMGATLNGMAAHGGVRPFGSTFLVFADYMKPAIRLAALMRLPVIYIFTHDSVGLGEDGPTHQPIDQLPMLRAVPGLTVIRPADPAETAQAWRVALERTEGPTALVLTRQKIPAFEGQAGAEGLRRGGYVLYDPPGQPEAIVIATGSEVEPSLRAATALTQSGLPTRVVSLPSWELFQHQPAAYRDQVLPPSIRSRLSVEAASTFGWRTWVGDQGETLGIDHFGASAPAPRLFQEFGFTAEHIAALVRRVHARRSS